MSSWLYLGIISLFCFSIINIVDRKFLGDLKVNPVVFPAIATTLGTFFTLLFLLFFIGIPDHISYKIILCGVIGGLIDFISASFFYYALSKAPISRVIALDRIKLLTSLFLAVLLFNENFYWIWVPGILLIIIGNILLIKKDKNIADKYNQGMWFMFIAGLISGFAIIPEKFGVSIGAPVLIAFLASTTRSIFYILHALIRHRHHFNHFINHLKQKKWVVSLIFRSFCSASGWVAFYYSLSIGLISKVTPLLQLRPVCAVLLAAFFLNEKETKRRLFATIIITIGALLIIY